MVPTPKESTHMPTPCRLPAPSDGWQPITIRAQRLLVSPIDGGMYVGRCLDHDVTVQGGSFDEIGEALVNVLITQCICDQSAGVTMLSTLGEAPDEVWKAWEQAIRMNVPNSVVHISVMVKGERKNIAIDIDYALHSGNKAA